MKQVCKFNVKPQTVNNGGYKKGRYILWLNLGVSEIEASRQKENERWESMTDRVVVDSCSLDDLLEALDPEHLTYATNPELTGILSFFNKENDLDAWKKIRKIQVGGYDRSEAVNSFQIGAHSLWFDKSTRVGLVNSVTVEKNAGKEHTGLWCGGDRIRLSVDNALSMLADIELYALECYNTTAQRLADIESADSVSCLKEMDVTEGYPARLIFQLPD